MAYLVTVLFALALLVGFVVLSLYEKQHGVRFLEEKRARLDAHIERIEFIVEHVDLKAFIKDEIKNALNRIGHAIANLSLQVVRAVERFLTHHVRALRTRHEDTAAPRESTREFVKTLSDFKDNLKTSHPDVGVPETGSEVE